MDYKKYLPIAATVAVGVGTLATPVMAQATPIDEMQTELTKVEAAVGVITTVAIASIVFNIGAKIVKRFVHS